MFWLPFLLHGQKAVSASPEKPISAVIAHESVDRAELGAIMGIRGPLTESYLAAQSTQSLTYRKLPSGMFAVAFWGKEFRETLELRQTFLNVIAKLIRAKKPLPLSQLSGRELEVAKGYIRLAAGVEPEDGATIFAGTSTTGLYRIQGKDHWIDESSSLPKFDPKSFNGLPCKPISDGQRLDGAKQYAKLMVLHQLDEVSVRPWTQVTESPQFNADLGACVTFYLDQKKLQSELIRKKIEDILKVSKETAESPPKDPPEKLKSIADKIKEREANERAKKGENWRSTQEIRKDGTLVGSIRNLEFSFALNVSGAVSLYHHPIQIPHEMLPKKP